MLATPRHNAETGSISDLGIESPTMHRTSLPPFPCFCFAVFVLCIPMGYEFGSRPAARGPAAHRAAPALASARAGLAAAHLPPALELPAAPRARLLAPAAGAGPLLAVSSAASGSPPSGARRDPAVLRAAAPHRGSEADSVAGRRDPAVQ